jgi:endonuclease/exonuclease/phosphatase family metal-dependent hydrolase
VTIRIICLMLLVAAAVEAGPVRVTTWDLQARASGETNAASAVPMQEAAGVLKALNPDIIVLQSVPDAQSAGDLAKALGSGTYTVAVCSAFSGSSNRQQVAILSRGTAEDSWSEMWKGDGQQATPPGGFAFAAIRFENRTLGVYSIQLADAAPGVDRESAEQQTAREEAARQLVQQIDSLRSLTTKTTQVLVVAGNFNTSPENPKLGRELTLTRLERAGLSNAFATVSPEKRITLPGAGSQSDATVDYVFTRDVNHVEGVQVKPVAFTGHRPVTVELNLDTPMVAAVPGAKAAEVTPTLATFWQAFSKQVGTENIYWLCGLLGGGVLLVVVGAWMIAKRAGSAMIPATSGAPGPSNPGEAMVPSSGTHTGASGSGPLVRIDAPAYTQTRAQSLQQRAEDAERRADRATAVVKAGLLPQLSRWLQGKTAQRLISDRQQLIDAQQLAARQMKSVDERLTKVETHIQQRTREYERRIGELQRELVAAKDENRELIRQKIAQVRAEMEWEREKILQHAQGEG